MSRRRLWAGLLGLAMAADDQGTVYLADRLRHRVLRLRPGLFGGYGLALLPGSNPPVLFVADEGNRRVRRLASTLATHTAGEAPFGRIVCVAGGPAGSFYTADLVGPDIRLSRFTPRAAGGYDATVLLTRPAAREPQPGGWPVMIGRL
jgi:hypothetical protein